VDRVLARHGFEIVRVPYSVDPTVTDGIPSAVGNRVNFLRVGDLVVMPAYDLPADAEAAAVMRDRLPSVRVVSLDCTDLARRGGVLNCVAATYRTRPQTPGPCESPG
jgi:agmatine deiminase